MAGSNEAVGSLTAILWALGANGGIAAAKFAAAVYTGSGAMLAEAIHSLADCANQVLLLIGMRQAGADVTEVHPLGSGRVVYFYAMMVALLLFTIGGAFSVWEGVQRLRHPEPVHQPLVALAILGVSVDPRDAVAARRAARDPQDAGRSHAVALVPRDAPARAARRRRRGHRGARGPGRRVRRGARVVCHRQCRCSTPAAASASASC